MITVGKTYAFDTHGGDSELNCRTGEECVVIRPLTEGEADLFETGPMYRVVFSDGFETDAFEDELGEIVIKTNCSGWSKALVELKPGYIIPDRTLMSKREFEEFLDEHGYKLLKWEQGTDPRCGR